MGIAYVSLVFVLVAAYVNCLPPRQDYTVDISSHCRYGNKVCKKVGNEAKCGDRYKLCPQYANKALDVVWSFCMYANEENIPHCEEQMKVEFGRITTEIRNDTWELNF